ncbi:ParB/RepB/Spo0J family partition protein [Chachezhania sediminis]|uniref:ParB/RepB/Spo0J family partition protein n=1 Tax=Chachezhania sediminis TaxID=2599291 RepID=UPI00131E4580|nr:ParB N-terminal domain-containing protein [Chachezhania sediminis]
MSGKNKFGFGPIDDSDMKRPRRREVGPMGAAVRETASSVNESTENLVEQRRRNAADAKAFRAAQDEGLVLVRLPLDRILADDLPRDRLDLDAVAASDEMEELKASIRARGQKEPVEVYESAPGVYQLKKGWRRLTALRQLHLETGDAAFGSVVARVAHGESSRIDLYIDMVEENVIREDLSFAEMAQVALSAASDAGLGESDAEALVGRIYASLHKMKRSYIRSFVFLLSQLGDALPFPKAVSRNLGVDVARRLQAEPGRAADLKAALAGLADADAQAEVLRGFLAQQTVVSERSKPVREKGVKYEFHVGSSKVTARKGECRILSRTDFSSVDRKKLERAIAAFDAVINEAE